MPYAINFPAILIAFAAIALQILVYSVPLMLSSFGALVSDSAGRLAIFMDGIINLAAFLCFAITVKSGSLASGCALSILLCVGIVAICLAITEISNADPFLMSLALGIGANALVSYLSSVIFHTRGVLTSAAFAINASYARAGTTIIALALLAIYTAAFMKTRPALYIRLCGEDSALLKARGVSIRGYISGATIVAGIFAAITGCTFALRLSSFVPGISSGTGWLSCAVVYIGRSIVRSFAKEKHGTGWATCLFVFASAIMLASITLCASRVQNVFKDIMPALLLALPYLASLLLLALIGKRR